MTEIYCGAIHTYEKMNTMSQNVQPFVLVTVVDPAFCSSHVLHVAMRESSARPLHWHAAFFPVVKIISFCLVSFTLNYHPTPQINTQIGALNNLLYILSDRSENILYQTIAVKNVKSRHCETMRPSLSLASHPITSGGWIPVGGSVPALWHLWMHQ